MPDTTTPRQPATPDRCPTCGSDKREVRRHRHKESAGDGLRWHVGNMGHANVFTETCGDPFHATPEPSSEGTGSGMLSWMRSASNSVEYEADGLPAYDSASALRILHSYACANFNDSPSRDDAVARLDKARDTLTASLKAADELAEADDPEPRLCDFATSAPGRNAFAFMQDRWNRRADARAAYRTGRS